MPRIFKYNGQQYQDPGEQYTVDDIKQHLSSVYPEIAQATVEEKTLESGDKEITFVKKAGTKG